jgi:flavodoxin
MRTLVVYDSRYGNTEQVAQAIGEAIDAQVLQVADVNPEDLKKSDLLIVGTPTHGGFPSEGIDGLLKASPDLKGVDAAVFDTRTTRTIFGYAAPKVAKRLDKGGATILAPPEGFFVMGKKGPLKDGELERAAGWARGITS